MYIHTTIGVVEVLATLSNSTSEVILELCAKCICNLTSKVDLHPNMIKSKVQNYVCMYVCWIVCIISFRGSPIHIYEPNLMFSVCILKILDIILMISLVRSVADSTRIICAKVRPT